MKGSQVFKIDLVFYLGFVDEWLKDLPHSEYLLRQIKFCVAGNILRRGTGRNALIFRQTSFSGITW
jgi:hypothetical protein